MKHIFFVLFFLLPLFVWANGNRGYYRFPAVHDSTIVFTAEGDLWKVSITGGSAERLTTDHGVESHAALSPDGQWIAFSGQYEGPTEIYIMPVTGGIPKRLTFEGHRATVVGWTPDGKILFSTARYSTLPNVQLVTVDKNSRRKAIIPLSQASEGVFEPQGQTLFFTRLPFQGSQTKRYKGGTAQNIWRYTLGAQEAIPLTTDYPGTSKNPMWWKGRIYFLSDRDGTMNIWSMKEDGSDLKQHTFHNGLDIGSAALSNGHIVYQLLADLYLYNIETDRDQKLDIRLTSDFDQMHEKWVKKPMKYLTAAHIAPDGSQVVLTARGQVFVAPAEQGRLVRATRKEGVRYREARFMPDGKTLLALSDESGEFEFHRLPANGVGKEETLTHDADVLRYQGVPSPDGKKCAFTDKNYRLWVYDFKQHKAKVIATSQVENFYNLAWSPDSRWLAYIELADNLFSQIKIYDSQSGKIHALTDNRVNSYNPSWSPDGKWLYFLSQRNLHTVVPSPWGDYQPEPFLDKTVKIYMVALEPGVRSPFLPDDELTRAEKQQKKKQQTKKSKKEKKKEKNIQVKIDFNGIQQRVIPVPLPAANYSGLAVNDGFLFWMEIDRTAHNKRTLKALKIRNKDIEAKKLLDGVKGFELSADGKKLLVRQKASLFVIDAKDNPPAKLSANKVNLNGWTYSLHPENEWRQMLIDAWRMERDYFYDPHLHGLNYKKVIQKYLPYVQRVTDRDELNDLIGQMVGELSALHTFVVGGDVRRNETKISQGFLGAVLKRDPQNKGYRIAHIYRTDPNFPERLSPLAKPEVNIQEGDVIQMVNGVPVLSVDDIAVLLKNQAGKQVLLGLYSPKEKKVYNKLVKPMNARQEADLRYSEWEYTRRLLVEKEGQGKLGYVHLRAMGGGNYREWLENFYPVFNRQGLIIDVRHNRGGNIDSWILEKLLRKIWFYWKPRVGKPTWNMQYAFPGHMVVLCDQFTASDGEAFSEGFRRLGLGKVIGMRTWGGEIWLSFSNRLVDMGIASAAETGVYGPEGKWLIEGHGVDPDIVVDNLPHATFEGKDAQLEAAIRYLQKKIKEEPVVIPPPPPYPDKTLKK